MHVYSFNVKICKKISTVFRDHDFDCMERKKVSRKIKFGNIAEPIAPSRGALPMRQFHKKDESKILPMKRLGIDVDDSVHI